MSNKELFFKELTSELSIYQNEAVAFSELFQFKQYSESDYFIREGELTHNCAFISQGIFRAYISDNEGKDANLNFIQKLGFASGSFAMGVPSTMNIQALCNCTVYFTDWYSISKFIKQYPTLALFFNNLLAKEHYNIMHRLSVNLRNGAKERYELFLTNYPNLINEIPHYHIANFLGITPIQLSRIRQKIAKPNKVV